MCIAGVIMVAGCRPAATATTPIDAGNPLEIAARDANLVEDPAMTPLTGLFERRHSAGMDGLCFVPTGNGQYRFGLSASFGSHLVCEGRGTAEQSAQAIQLRFDESDCRADAVFDGRSVRIAGRVPDACAALCGPRASISGVAASRVGWDAADALRLPSRADALRGAVPRALCAP